MFVWSCCSGALQKFVMDVNGEEESKAKHEDPPALEEVEHETGKVPVCLTFFTFCNFWSAVKRQGNFKEFYSF